MHTQDHEPSASAQPFLVTWGPLSGRMGLCCRPRLAFPHAEKAACFLFHGIIVTMYNFMTNSVYKTQHNCFYNVAFEVKNSN